MAAKVITLVSEGTTDVGALGNPLIDWHSSQEGFLQNLLARCVPYHDLLFFSGEGVALDMPGSTTASSALARKAEIAGALATYQYRADAVVFVVDADNDTDPETHRLTPIQDGLASGIAKAMQGDAPVPIAALARRTIEAWVLADMSAVQAVAGQRFTQITVPNPEALWGAPHDPESNHPKQILRRAFSSELDSSDYAAVGEVADPDIVLARCPVGFGPLHEALREACP